KKRIGALEREQQSLSVRALEAQPWIEVNQSLDAFVARLNQTVEKLGQAERQKLVRLLVKQIDVGKETITIHHSIPIEQGHASENAPSYPLYQRRRAAKCRDVPRIGAEKLADGA